MSTVAAGAAGGRRAWVVWAAALAVYMLSVFHRSSLGVAGILAAHRFGISAGQLSTFVMVQLLVYAGMQIPVGALLDRFGSRRMIFVGLTLMTVAQVCFAFISSYPLGLVARVFVGAGDAMVFISVLRLVAGWFRPMQVPVVAQLTGMLGQLGAVSAAVPLSTALEQFGWTRAYLGAASIGVVFAVVLFLVVRDSPDDTHVGLPLSWRQLGLQVRTAWRAPGTRLGMWMHFSTQFSTTTMALLWGFPFLVTVEQLSSAQASALLTVPIFTAMLVGPLLGRHAARQPYHRSTVAIVLVLTIMAVWSAVLLWPGQAPIWLLVALMMVIGAGAPASMVGFDQARMFNPADRHGTATGMVNIGGFIATLVTVTSIGVVLDLLTPGSSSDYTADHFRMAMCVQYLIWGFGLLQIWRYRRRTRRHLLHTDPDAFDALRRGELFTVS